MRRKVLAFAVVMRACVVVLVMAACVFLGLQLFGVGYVTVVGQRPGGGTAWLHGWRNSSSLKCVIVYGDIRDVRGDYRISPTWGVAWERLPKGDGAPPLFLFAVADWLPALILLACAFWCYRRGRERLELERQKAIGRCPVCKYDLRAHKPGQRCPECGTEIPKFGWRKPN
jgi:hypothetical protein